LPVLLTLGVFPGWAEFFWVVGLFIVLELLSNNFMEPLLYGRSIGVSEVALIVAAAFWTWLWGPLGLVLATPLTACMAVMGRYVPYFEFLGILLGDQPVLDPHHRYFQRLLARDQDEATDLVEDYAEKHGLEETCDELLLPALVLTGTTEDRGNLEAADVEYISHATREVLADIAPDMEPTTTEAMAEDSERLPLVLGCPARDEMDELPLHMLGALLDPGKAHFEIVSSDTLSSEIVARVRKDKPAIVCISTLPPEGIAQTRYLCKRLRAQFPDLKILVGCWGREQNIEKLRTRMKAVGAYDVAANVGQLRELLYPLLLVPVRSEQRPELAKA
jgi:hypothetical protein